MRAVFLDAASLGSDVDLTPLREAAGHLVTWDRTEPEQVAERIAGYDTVLTNKVVITREHFEANPALRLVAVVATGVNNVDLKAAEAGQVRVVNVVRYGRTAVAQHTMALILALANHLPDYMADVRQGEWQRSPMFSMIHHPIMELDGRTLGIVGYGDLGQGLAVRARAFGMNVLVGARPGQGAGEVDGYPRLPLDELLPRVDVLSLHCLLTQETRNLIGAAELAAMPDHALLINTSRGGLIDEQALADALRAGTLGGAGIDVLSEEPPVNGNPLLAEDIPNLIVTPHCAWASREARQRIVNFTANNLRRMREGTLERWVV